MSQAKGRYVECHQAVMMADRVERAETRLAQGFRSIPLGTLPEFVAVRMHDLLADSSGWSTAGPDEARGAKARARKDGWTGLSVSVQ